MKNKSVYLVVDHVHRAKDGTETNKKGWTQDGKQWAHFERPYAVDSLSPSVIQRASVIIDVLTGTVVKNRWPDKTADEVKDTYLAKYQSIIMQGMTAFMQKSTGTKPSALALLRKGI